MEILHEFSVHDDNTLALGLGFVEGDDEFGRLLNVGLRLA